MKITKEWLKENNACTGGYEWFCSQKETDSIALINKLMKKNLFNYANWLITTVIDKEQRIKYAIYAAELVLPIYEAKYSDDNRPAKAIKATENYLKNKTDAAAAAAAYASVAAYNASSDATSVAASSAAYASYAAASVAASVAAYDASYYAASVAATSAAYASSVAAYDAADAAADAATYAAATTKRQIIKYGIELIKDMIK